MKRLTIILLFINLTNCAQQKEIDLINLQGMIKIDQELYEAKKEPYGLEIYTVLKMFPSLNEKLIRSVILHESSYDSTAISKAGAIGLMQIMPSSARLFQKFFHKKRDINNNQDNIIMGSCILSHNIELFGLEKGLVLYNGGSNNLRRWARKDFENIPKETLEYVPKVMKGLE